MDPDSPSHGHEAVGSERTTDELDPVLIHQRKDHDTPPKVIEHQWPAGVSTISTADCDGIRKDNKNNGVNSSNGNVEVVSLVTSLLPLDDNYLKAAAKKQDDAILFMDTEGNNGPVLVDSSSSDSVMISESEECNGTGAHLKDQEYRDQSDCSSVSDLSVIDYDSEIEIEIEEIFRKGPHLNNRKETANPGELLLKDLPPIQDLRITVPEAKCQKVGVISGIVNELVVIQALPNTPALDLGTVLFMDNGKTALGEIFDVFGRVKEPYYTIRFNSERHARSRGVKEGVEIYCAPKTEYTTYVFLHEMIKMKGSDASWENNHEPPAHCLDYSDDEEERASRRKKQAQQKQREESAVSSEIDDGSEDVEVITDISHFNPANRASGTGVARVQRHNANEVNGHSERNGRCGNAHSTGSTHWREALPNYVQPAMPPNLINRALDDRNSHSAPVLHPPGHPPVQSENSGNWGGSNSYLKAARRINLHLFRNLPCYQQVLDGTYPLPRPRPPSRCLPRFRSVPQWLLHLQKSSPEFQLQNCPPILTPPEPQPRHRPPLLSPPELQPQHRPPLLPSPESQHRPPLLPSPESQHRPPLLPSPEPQPQHGPPLLSPPKLQPQHRPSLLSSPELQPQHRPSLLSPPKLQPQHRPPLLLPPISSSMPVSTSPRLPSLAPVSVGPFAVPPPSPNRGLHPHMMPGALRQPNAHLNQPIPRPMPNMNATSCPPPVNGPFGSSTLQAPPGFPPHYQISSNVGSSLDSMNSFTNSLPLPPQSAGMPNNIRPFMLRPSYLFSNSPTTLPRQ